MTVASQTNRVSFAGNGVTLAFAFAAPYRVSSDLVVTLRTNATLVDVTQVEGVDYTVAGAANAGTGGFDSATVTMTVAPAAGKTLVINRLVPLTSALDPNSGAAVSAANLEGAIDRAMLAMQGLQEQLGRTLILAKGSPLSNLVLPEPAAANANQLLGIKSTGDGFDLKVPAALSLATVSSFIATLLDDVDGPTALATLGAVGKQTLYVPAGGMTARTTLGAAAGSVETATQKVMIKTLDFDPATNWFAQFAVQMPKSWNEGTVSAIFVWSHAATATNFGVVWGIQGLALSDNDAQDTAFGAAQEVTDTGGVTNNLYRSPETAAVTIGNTPVENDVVVFQVYRNAAAGADTLAINARLQGVLLFFTTNAGNDA